jgi:sugar fermentation stimulation protein A
VIETSDSIPIGIQYPGPVRRVRFLSRPNRFLVWVSAPGTGPLEAHLPDPGRLGELLRPRRTWGHIVPAPSQGEPRRRTGWTLVNVADPARPKVLVGVDTRLANRMVQRMIEQGIVQAPAPGGTWIPEYPWKGSRIDFVWKRRPEDRTPHLLLEVKMANLRQGETALFPDAVTPRGTHHLELLTEHRRQGHASRLLWLASREDVQTVRAHGGRDPDFARQWLRAQRAGVDMAAWRCRIGPADVKLDREIGVGDPYLPEDAGLSGKSFGPRDRAGGPGFS